MPRQESVSFPLLLCKIQFIDMVLKEFQFGLLGFLIDPMR